MAATVLRRAQIDAVVIDIGVNATKTGMLATAGIIAADAATVRDHCLTPLVVDPVMVAESGAALLADDAHAALLSERLPLATLITPNLLEAEALSGLRIASVPDMRRAARVLIG